MTCKRINEVMRRPSRGASVTGALAGCFVGTEMAVAFGFAESYVTQVNEVFHDGPNNYFKSKSKRLRRPWRRYRGKRSIYLRSQIKWLQKSIVSLLEKFSNVINEQLNNYKHVLCIFVDFLRAFDCINHRILLQMLEKVGIRVVHWLLEQ